MARSYASTLAAVVVVAEGADGRRRTPVRLPEEHRSDLPKERRSRETIQCSQKHCSHYQEHRSHHQDCHQEHRSNHPKPKEHRSDHPKERRSHYEEHRSHHQDCHREHRSHHQEHRSHHQGYHEERRSHHQERRSHHQEHHQDYDRSKHHRRFEPCALGFSEPSSSIPRPASPPLPCPGSPY